MPSHFEDTGAFNVDGQWATAIRYEARSEGGDGAIKDVRLRFSNGRHELASIWLSAADARDVLGERNYAVVVQAIAAATPGAGFAKGELRGKTLAFRQVVLPGHEALPENAIYLAERLRTVDPLHADSSPRPPSEGDGRNASGVERPRQPEYPAAEATPSPRPHPTGSVDDDRATAVPAWVRERFLATGNRYYFTDRTLAFTDHGTKLKAETNNVAVVKSLTAIAEARAWDAIRVSGSEEFRRLTWREASLRGIDVAGYAPSDVEREELRRAMVKCIGRDQSDADATAIVASPAEIPPTDTRAAAAARPKDNVGASAKPEDMPRPALLTGELLESGAAPYHFDQQQGMSYYVKLHTAHGERTLWGVDLERALVESKTRVKIGDTVSIENQGSQPVTVKSLQRDAEGHATDKTITTHRNQWRVESPDYFHDRAALAWAFRREADGPKQGVAYRHPDLSNALVGLWLGEQFAAKVIDRPEDRERVITLVKERIVQALERGDSIDVPKLRQDVAQRLERIPDEPESIGSRARARSASRGARDSHDRTAVSPEVPPHVLA